MDKARATMATMATTKRLWKKFRREQYRDSIEDGRNVMDESERKGHESKSRVGSRKCHVDLVLEGCQ